MYQVFQNLLLFNHKKHLPLFLLFITLVLALAYQPALAEEKRANWDQKEAVRKVKSVIAQEQKGDFAWDKIDWLTDPSKAARTAQEEGKPIFVFFFLKKDVGPKAAPC